MKLKSILALAAATLCMTICLAACGDNNAAQTEPTTTTPTTVTTQPTQEEPAAATFEVTVVDQNGNAVQGVMMQLCKDVCVPKLTDANGVAVFEAEITDGYKLSVLSCPAGYTYEGEAEIYLDSGITEYTVELQGEA